MRILTLAIPWALLGTTLRSQQDWDWSADAHWNPVRTTEAGLPQNELARGIVTGNFTGHIHLDVALLLGTDVAFCTAPTVHNHSMKVVPQLAGGPVVAATGLGMLPRGGSYGRDLLVIASATGLYGWSVDTGTTSLETGNWQSVCVGDVDGYAPDDFVGLGTNGTTCDRIRICSRREGYANVVSEIVFTNEVAAKVVLAQWGSQFGPLEICVATNTKLWIGNAAGTIEQVTLPNDGNGQLVRMRGPGQTDRLAWLGQVSGQKRLRSFRAGCSSDQDATWIGTATDLCAGDWNHDQVDDLIVARSGAAPLVVLSDPSPTATVPFTTEGSMVVSPFSNPQPIGVVWPAAWLGDLDGDLDPDLFMVSRITSLTGVATTTLWPCRSNPASTVRPHLSGTVSIVSNPVTGSTNYALELLPTAPVTDPMPTHLELLVYQGDISSGMLRTNPTPFRRVRLPYSGSPIPEISWRMPTASAPEAFMGAIRWIHVANGATTHAWPSTLFVIGVDGALVPYQEWIGPRIEECNLPGGIVWPNSIDGYSLHRPLSLSATSDQREFTGDDGAGTGDLPPPPPDPPKPPTPPPPPPPGP